MTKAQELFDSGRVLDAIVALGEWLRSNPTDVQQRTFLFELLCFAAQYDRAEKQLSILSQETPGSQLGATVYYAALHAERERNSLFQKQAFPKSEAPDRVAGNLNGKSFSSFRDADPDIGARLEVYAAGAYLWIPFEHLALLQLEPPRRLRDTLWTPAAVETASSFRGMELGEVLIPAIYPFSWKDSDMRVWLGRETVWDEDADGNKYPSGQKIFLVDGEEFPLLEVRTLMFEQTGGS